MNQQDRSPPDAPDSRLAELDVGQRLGDFVLIRSLGGSGASRVFAAQQQSMQRLVALKVHAHAGGPLPALVQLDHAHIVRVFDSRASSDGKLRLTHMQHMPGGSLEDVAHAVGQLSKPWSGLELIEWLDQRRPHDEQDFASDSIQREKLAALTWPEVVCTLGVQIASGLQHAAHHGAAHPNLVASNILLTEHGVPKVAGIENATASSKSYDKQAEALSAVLWQTLTGQTAPQPLNDKLTEQSSASSRGLVELLRRALSNDRSERLVSLDQLAAQLRVCATDESARLLLPPREPWRQFAVRAPLAASLLTLMVPNILAGIFNYRYNYEQIVAPLNANDQFGWIMTAVNATAYPGALAIAVVMVWKLCREVKERHARTSVAPASQRLRRACLDVPGRFAILGISAWCLAGIVYPVALRLAGTDLGGTDGLHFFASLVMCGLIGATYPFLGATAIAVNAWYPALIRPDVPTDDDVASLRRLETTAPIYLVLASAVPLVALGLLALLDQVEHPELLGMLSLGAVACLVAVFFWWNRTSIAIKTLKTLAERS